MHIWDEGHPQNGRVDFGDMLLYALEEGPVLVMTWRRD